MRRKQLRALAMAALVAALLTLPLGFKVAASDDVITQAALTGAAINGVMPHGVAEYRLRADGRRSFKVEARDVNLPVNTRLDVAVDGARVGALIINALHHGELELNSGDGQTVPAVTASSTVTVTNAANIIIIAGAFNTPAPTPSATPSPSPNPSPSPSPNPTPAPTPQGVVELRLRIALVGANVNGVTPHGAADFRRRADGSRSLKVEVEDVNLPAGTLLDVLLDNLRIGSLTLDGQRTGELELNTRNGQTFPPVVNGTTIVVADRAGVTIAAGAFAATLPLPGPTPTPLPSPSPSPAPGMSNNLRAILTGGTLNGVTPKGLGEVRQPADGSRYLKVKVEDVNLPAGTRLDVLLDSTRVGSITFTSFFKGELELNSNDEQPVPPVNASSTVVVAREGGGTVVAGAFNPASSVANPADDHNFFVRQHYVDFLERGPETEGFDAWVGVLNRCARVNDDATCDRVEVSSAFFRSQEFQLKGFFVYRFYQTTLGRLPRYAEFVADMHSVTGSTAAEVEQRRHGFAEAWLERPEFHARYDAFTDPRAFVERILETGGVALTTGALTRDTLIEDLRAGRRTRAEVVRAVVEHPEVEAREYNGAFVAMQYFGYLRRDPEDAGYRAWLRVIDRGDSYRVMINGFMNSLEYRGRFGQQ